MTEPLTYPDIDPTLRQTISDYMRNPVGYRTVKDARNGAIRLQLKKFFVTWVGDQFTGVESTYLNELSYMRLQKFPWPLRAFVQYPSRDRWGTVDGRPAIGATFIPAEVSVRLILQPGDFLVGEVFVGIEGEDTVRKQVAL